MVKKLETVVSLRAKNENLTERTWLNEKEKTSWNHNYAYNRWVSKKIGKRNSILDVGCGDGTLALHLRTTNNKIIGIDIADSSIQKANNKNVYSNVSFIRTSFENFQANNRDFDAIVFVHTLLFILFLPLSIDIVVLVFPLSLIFFLRKILFSCTFGQTLYDTCNSILYVLNCLCLCFLFS